ncbi:hypothetical protein JYP46_19245 [Nitratireductor aquimarinus]|uniref:hypothetical protein n=1 Tax=Alphaproteobacteria TaxID=28211 RepID=UPI0019D32EBF|nr:MULTISPECIES: hypothetical protein [Alphaproteobacteria]MBN7758968.1 hypothetical protein [Nitratireductor aquimarinus]MBY6001641.1 hypothetical protein [Tritonibacter mobilis]MBY6023929.1 hypothetical protein [Nitratireductor sp. DP7N14-4]
MRERLENAALILLGSLMALAGLAFTLFMFVVVTAPFWSIGLIALWVVGLI